VRLALGLLAAALVVAAPAAAAPGPALREPEANLRAAFGCEPATAAPERQTVVLIHGGLATAGQWEYTYEPALQRLGFPTCEVTIPDRATIDAQRSAEYVVSAIRAAARRSGRPVAVVGHSFGGAIAAMVLKLWPDLAQSVDDVVGLAGVYTNGSQSIRALCAAPCPPGAWQLAAGSRLQRALAARSLYRGPSFTTLGTDYDELVTPQPSAGRLDGATNLNEQQLCPGRVVDHVSILLDSFAFAVVLDALEHPGPADPARIGSAPCARFGTYPGAQPARLLEEIARAAFAVPAYAGNVTTHEPALRCAWDPECPTVRLQPSLTLRLSARRASGELLLPDGARDQCGGAVIVRAGRASRRAAVGLDCRFSARVRGRCATVAFGGTPELLPVSRAARSCRR
jgi:pimeloyl-ACP methyl ester carboxylesterase